MQSRIDYGKAPAGAMKAMQTVQQYANGSGLEPRLLELMKRASQINGCAYAGWTDMATMRGPFGFDWESEIESTEWVQPGKEIKDLDDRMELFDGLRFDESRLLRCKNALFAEYHNAILGGLRQ